MTFSEISKMTFQTLFKINNSIYFQKISSLFQSMPKKEIITSNISFFYENLLNQYDKLIIQVNNLDLSSMKDIQNYFDALLKTIQSEKIYAIKTVMSILNTSLNNYKNSNNEMQKEISIQILNFTEYLQLKEMLFIETIDK